MMAVSGGGWGIWCGRGDGGGGREGCESESSSSTGVFLDGKR